jgi:probable rRNA maturation factor
MIELQVDQHAIARGERIEDALFERLMSLVQSGAGHLDLEGNITLVFVDDVEIQRLNRMYRNKDAVTDVLAFSYLDYYAPGELIGEIVISAAQAKRQAHGSLRHEVIMLAVHGVLHVLGYDHMKASDAERMFSIQDKIVDQLV